MWTNSNVEIGMFVTGTKGERIGKVIRCDKDTFVVEKGVFFPKDYELRYDHITGIGDGGIRYSLSEFLQRETQLRAAGGEAQRVSQASPAASSLTAAASAAALERERARAVSNTNGEIRIPLMTEEVDVEKVTRETGHVRVHKAVKTEERHFTVPTMREEITIEHVALDPDARLAPGAAAFQEQTVDVTLHEEEILVTKRPVLREEVVVRTTARSVENEGSATLRHEEAEVEDIRKTPGARIDSYSSPSGRTPRT